MQWLCPILAPIPDFHSCCLPVLGISHKRCNFSLPKTNVPPCASSLRLENLHIDPWLNGKCGTTQIGKLLHNLPITFILLNCAKISMWTSLRLHRRRLSRSHFMFYKRNFCCILCPLMASQVRFGKVSV